MKNILLQVEGVSKRFPGVLALDKVNFALGTGEVHALVGENGAGKSTLMNIITGLIPMTEGSMKLAGEDYEPHSPLDALSQGVSMIHQEISLVNSMPVYENIWLGNEKKFGAKVFVKKKDQIAATDEMLRSLNMDIESEKPVGELSISKKQMVEVARAICCDAKVIIMDEPSSSLTEQEVEKLFEMILNLKNEGKSVVYISHKIDEIYKICDKVTVFRDGQFVAEKQTKNISKQGLVNLMVGRELTDMYPKIPATIGESIMEVRNFNREGKFHGINFSVRGGEILGFCGLVGAGRTELMQAIFGIDKKDTGSVFLKGKEIKIQSTGDAIRNGIAMVTEDRRGTGLVAGMSVKANTSLAYLEQITKWGFVDQNAETAAYNEMKQAMSIKAPSDDTVVALLSGGNQQKVIIGKWLLTKPDVLIMDEPTRGIDVGAKSEIYRLMGKMAAEGKGVIMVSSELPELFGICDRILVMHQGRLTDEFLRGDFSQEKIMQSAFGLKERIK
ncbi:MAG: sugar ABC transporter ATP-binding protein [Spirochaetaceae bacterium]|nr:sugar ABC transporter ATP-binding protein [Spirochaetaceae bacterium]